MSSRTLGVLPFAILWYAPSAAAQFPDSRPHTTAVRTSRAPAIDGRLDEAMWSSAPAASGFRQMRPSPGDAESHRTEAIVLYDDEAVYVGMRAFDAADSITAQLTRRDEWGSSDRLHVLIDSWHDRRSAYHFVVNPLGARLDIYHYNDTQLDFRWNPVWDVATRIDSLGWTAEFRIPLSQLRFADRGAQTWGINFFREIARRNEWSVWSKLPVDGSALVSAEGVLDGVADLQPMRRLEVLPFVVGSTRAQPVESGNPFSLPRTTTTTIGADIKYGIASTMMLDLTVNPDFGHVEADPSQVNLTAFESFFEERRPFFLEGAGIFQFPLSSQEQLFYSRRIGRAPQGAPSERGGWANAPDQADLVAAAKLSGQPRPGWSLGALTAVTDEVSAQVIDSVGQRHSDLVEPRTSYSFGRLQRDFRSGRSGVGVVATATVRDLSGGLAELLHARAFTGGFEGRHRFRRDDFSFETSLLASRVEGTAAALLRTQRASTRYFQRPDAAHVDLDSSRTELSGWAAAARLQKVAGSPLRFGGGVLMRSPGAEFNDIGLQHRADQLEQFAFAGYVNREPGRVFREFEIFTNRIAWHTFARERVFNAYSLFVSGTFLNFTGTSLLVQRRLRALSAAELRGGPALVTQPRTIVWLNAHSNNQRRISGSVELNGSADDGNGSHLFSVKSTLNWRPASALQLSLGPSVSGQLQDVQFVKQASTSSTPRWVVGRLRQTTAALVGRADYALSPTLTVQGYLQPFASAGSFSRFREVTDSRARKYADRFTSLRGVAPSGAREIDTDGDGNVDLRFDDPAFQTRELRSNFVLRWEFRPGSTLYAVWSHARDADGDDLDVRPGRDLRDLLKAPSVNALALKVSYWWSP